VLPPQYRDLLAQHEQLASFDADERASSASHPVRPDEHQ